MERPEPTAILGTSSFDFLRSRALSEKMASSSWNGSPAVSNLK